VRLHGAREGDEDVDGDVDRPMAVQHRRDRRRDALRRQRINRDNNPANPVVDRRDDRGI
jgi:hypothetical protein